MTTHAKLIDQLLAYPKFGTGIGLHRIAALTACVQEQFADQRPDFIKLTGSNGKGSTAALITAILNALAIPNGAFTSPHLFQFNERIAVNGKAIADTHLQAAYDGIRSHIAAIASPQDEVGRFEVYTSLALYHFARMAVNHGVFEAGIGGRYDPVRLVPGQICGLTSLDLEHTDLLGHSLELIAFEKLNLCPPGGTMILFPLKDAHLLKRIHQYAELCGIQLVESQKICTLLDVELQPQSSRFSVRLGDWHLQDLCLAIPGKHQIENAQVALSCLWYYQKKLPHLSPAQWQRAIRQGLANVSIPGRADYISGPPEIHFDVGHTPQAVAQFAALLRMKMANKRMLLVLGVSENRALSPMIAPLCELADEVICTRAYHRGTSVAELVVTVREDYPNLALQQTETVEAAIDLALVKAKTENMAVVIAGSLFLPIEAIHYFRGGDPHTLRFF